MPGALADGDGATGVTVGNKIIELNPNASLESPNDVPEDDEPALTTDEISVLAEILSDVGANDASAQLEIERRHMAENPEHTIRFTANTLTEVALSLAVARTMAHYFGDRETMETIGRFGRLIAQTDSAPMAAEYQDLEYPGMVPGDGQGDSIDPFKAIRGAQYLHFTDEDGELVPISEPERLTFYDEENLDDEPEDDDIYTETITPE